MKLRIWKVWSRKDYSPFGRRSLNWKLLKRGWLLWRSISVFTQTTNKMIRKIRKLTWLINKNSLEKKAWARLLMEKKLHRRQPLPLSSSKLRIAQNRLNRLRLVPAHLTSKAKKFLNCPSIEFYQAPKKFQLLFYLPATPSLNFRISKIKLIISLWRKSQKFPKGSLLWRIN